MAKLVVNPGALANLTHAEDLTILGYFKSYASAFSKGTVTILSHMKATAAALMAAGLTGAGITVFYSGPGKGMGGSETFGVPGPEVGTGLSFAVAASFIGLFAYYRSKRSSAV